MTNIIPLNYDGLKIRFNDEGWINATDVAAKFGKETTSWLRQIDVLEYMSALSKKLFGNSGFLTEINEIRKLDTSTAASRSKVLRFVKATRLVATKTGPQGGTWIHPKLAIRFARWLSVDFEIWCDEQIDAIVRGGSFSTTDSRITAMFLLDESVPWEKRFSDPFYAALFKMSGLPRHRPNRRPALFGMISAKWVYGPVLPEDVYQEVKSRLAKGEKIHQHLKPEALKLVEHQIIAVTSIANGCADYRDFESRCMAAFHVKGQMKMLYAAA